jgi:hypothetical protein
MVNNICNWMFKKEATKGTASITNTTTKGSLFGLMDNRPNFSPLGNTIGTFQSYAIRKPTLNYGNRKFPTLSLPFDPMCAIADWWFLGKSASGSPNTIQPNDVGSGYNPPFTTRCEEKGGVQEELYQYVGCQAVGIAGKIQEGEKGWKYTEEVSIDFDEYEDNCGSTGVTQRSMCGADYQPEYIGSVDTRYTEPPVITYDYGGAGSDDISEYVNRFEYAQSRANDKMPISSKKQSQSLGSYSPVDIQLFGILENTTHIKNIIDKNTHDWSVKLAKSADTTKYKTLIFENVKYEDAKKIWSNEYYYMYQMFMKAEYYTVQHTLEAGITHATFFEL